MLTHRISDPLSPLDGRYARETTPLREYFSEFALLRSRVRVELDYLRALSVRTHLVRGLTSDEETFLSSLVSDFDEQAAKEIKAIEARTKHDVKAVELFLRQRLGGTSLADMLEWVHFGLTSEDVNMIAQAIALRDSRDDIILPALDGIISRLRGLVAANRDTTMLARTHGQPAVPTTLGKELAVYLVRLKQQRRIMADHRFQAKLTGAVGNLNALAAAAPQIDWLEFSNSFVAGYGLEPNVTTTQLVPYDNWIRYFDALRLANSILVDLAQDLWRYISDDYLTSKVVAEEVGSSTMPQKVNPIDLENAEGNLGLANALFAHYAQKLPITRLQRDLSDSTVRRTFGVAVGHTLVAYLSLSRGLDKIDANRAKIESDLSAHWDVIAEGAQTILRAAGLPNAYDQLKALTRGRGLSEQQYHAWVSTLHVDAGVKQRLEHLSPFSYIGLAREITDCALEESEDT